MKIFVTGISTDVGKTICAAIITEALQADYWKPIQAGDLHFGDADRVKSNLSNEKTIIHPNSYALHTPASPHFAAEIDNISIQLSDIIEPETTNHLVIEGAGGLLVPLNNTDCVIDLIKPDYKVIVVSRHYLGSINHTLLTIEALKNRNITIAGILFSGEKNEATELIIASKTSVKIIGRIEQEPYFDQAVITEYADLFKAKLLAL